MSWPPAFPILSLLVWAPAAGALLSALPREELTGLRRRISLGFAAATLVLAVALTFHVGPGEHLRELRRWIPTLGFSYDLSLDAYRVLLTFWIALLGLLALVSAPSGRRATLLVLLAETALLGLATAGDGALFLAFYGALILALAILLERGEAMRTFFFFQSAGLALAFCYVAIVYHLTWVQTGFPSAEIARFSSLVTFPDFERRMFLLGASVFAFAAPLFPFTSWVASAGFSLSNPGRLMLFGGFPLASASFFVRAVVPSYTGGEGALVALAVLSLLYAGLASRRSWAALLVGCQGLVALALLSGVAGRAGVLPMALALSALALWTSEPDDAPGAIPGGLALLMFLPTAWLVLRERWSAAPLTTAFAGLGFVLMMFHLARSLPPLSRRRAVLLLPVVGLWAISFLAPSRFAAGDAKVDAVQEEE